MIKPLIHIICMAAISTSSHAVETIEVQGLFSNKAVIRIDGTRHILSVGETSPEGVRVISANSKFAVLEINGKQQQYTLGNTISTQFKKSKQVTEQVFANRYGMFLTHGSINGHSVQFLVDTGATTVAMSAVQAKKIGLTYRLHGQPTKTSTASGIADAWVVKLKSVRLGQLKQSNVEAVVIEGNHPRHVLLGMSFLDQIKVQKEGDKMIFEMKQ